MKNGFQTSICGQEESTLLKYLYFKFSLFLCEKHEHVETISSYIFKSIFVIYVIYVWS